MSNEKWKAVVGWEGLYEVSDQGRVRRVLPSHVLTPYVDSVGRREVMLYRDGRRSLRRVHRLVLEAFVGPPPAGTLGCHNDGDAANNVVTNLRWDTYSENEFDKVRHGTHQNARKTSCPHGHEYTPANTRIRPSGARECRACTRARKSARRSRG